MAGKDKKKKSDESEIRPRLILAGPEAWRSGTEARLKLDKRFTVTERIEADFNVVELARVSPGDVLVSTVDPEFGSPAIKLALALQKKVHGLAVVFVLPEMFRDELDAFEDYRQLWTLVSSDTGEHPEMLAEAVWSASRGMVWVDPEMARRLKNVRAVSDRRSIPVAGFDE
ncbi:MAG: hypothetical protein HOC77_09210 [Chloroflexi bacterium]|nr:hypothetical protein [Chloroflexota bacterium]MBT4072685.1 hypothetical protein [Chloroflexota bacterium]MBT4515250.1 hypothetical protein [Chloroflexota bacterium]MBT5318431.1 hypothetical protein [Chloroflexota bacterium]MBT6681003.1 hypothetical protein [Chloroflexota bacterium]